MAVVFIFGVEDIDADGWMAELAVVADSRGDAHRILRNRGVKKKQFGNEGRPVRELALSDVADWLTDATVVFRRRHNAGGWSGWEPVANDVSLDWRISGKARRIGPGGRIL